MSKKLPIEVIEKLKNLLHRMGLRQNEVKTLQIDVRQESLNTYSVLLAQVIRPWIKADFWNILAAVYIGTTIQLANGSAGIADKSF